MAYQTVNPANNQLIKEYPRTRARILKPRCKKLTRSITPTGPRERLTNVCRYCISWLT